MRNPDVHFHMSAIRLFAFGLPFLVLPFFAVFAQTEQQPQVLGRTTVTEVIAPVTVVDHDDRPLDGLSARQFRLFDNGKEQNIKLQTSYTPISLVIAIQANSATEAMLPPVRKVGSMLESVLVGDSGEVAVMAFDHRLRVMQDFTSDLAKLSEAVQKINPGSSSARMIDAVQEASRMLKRRPANRRRVLLLISETRDVASEGRGREALVELQLANVTVYTVNMSRLATTLTAKQQPPRPDPLPPAARSMPSNVPATPNNVAQKTGNQGGSFDAVPLMMEIFRDVKAIFIDNPVEAFTKGTGGREYHFIKQKALEEAITKISEEIHSQYLVTYSPNNAEEGGFHEIKVTVDYPSPHKVRTRPGYWVASRF